MGSMVLLSKIARDVSWKAKNGSIDATLTYENFLGQWRRCNDEVGDEPTLRRHQYPAAPIVDSTNIQFEHPTDSLDRNGITGDNDADVSANGNVPNEEEKECCTVAMDISPNRPAH
eukprot:14776102-Ditylum_brightwellii.AAC.1